MGQVIVWKKKISHFFGASYNSHALNNFCSVIALFMHIGFGLCVH